MRETFTQKRKSLLVMISMLFLAVIGGKAYAEVADNEVTDGISVSITPTEGEVESLKDFVITFEGCNAAEWTFAKVSQIKDEEGNVVANLQTGENASATALTGSIAEAITKPGKYTLNIPKGSVSFNKVMEYTNPEAISFSFVIKSKEPAISSVNMVLGETSTDLLAGQNIEKLIGDANIVVKVDNSENIGVMTWEMNEVGGEIIKSRSTEVSNKNGTFTFWNPRDIELTLGKQYEIVFTGWESTEAKNNGEPNFTQKVIVNGGTKAYEYSPVTLVEPAELLYGQNEVNFSLESAEDNTISFTFSDVVTIAEAFVPLGMGETESCEVAMSEDGKTANITIPNDVINSYHNFVVSLLVKDANGLVVKGNNGEKDGSYISVYVDAKFNLPEVTMVDPAPDATVEKISTIKFGYADGIQPSWFDNITILDKTRNVVAKSVDVTSVIPEGEENNDDYIVKEVVVSFNNEITENGTYTVVVPEGMFNLDLTAQGFNMKSNREATFNITVDNGDKPSQAMHVSANPQEGEVGSLKDFEFTFMDYNSCAWTYEAMPFISDGDGNKLATISNVDYGTGLNQLVCSLKGEITEPGTYILTIPAGAVTYNDDPDNLNSEVTFTYTIADKSNENVTITPAAGNVSEIPALLILTFNDQTEVGASGNCTLVDDKGNSYKAELGIYWEGDYNQLQIELADGAITAEGTYTLTIPAGAVSYGSSGDSSNGELTFVFVIGNATAISNIFAAEGNVEIYNANGQLVKRGDASAIKTLAPNKMYIINGKKVIIK